MIHLIKEFLDEGNILVRMFQTSSKTHPITVQMLDDECGEIVEKENCTNMMQAEKIYNSYMHG